MKTTMRIAAVHARSRCSLQVWRCRADLSREARARRDPVAARRIERHRRAHRRAEALRARRPAVRRRQSRRRVGDHRLGSSSRRARRTATRSWSIRRRTSRTRTSIKKLPYDTLKDFTGDRAAERAGRHARGASVAAGEDGEGAHRAREGAARADRLRLLRQRQLRASHDGALQRDDRHEDDPHPVQGRRPGDASRSRRARRRR